ncbi:hypothetical protein EHN06_17285 [Marinobacter sp. NP-4(2019)]|uniref:hypothetical protein n=1 Tax=Marinobacter sp. NP-4(2019) TaxID=2488665 RepID=UPI000FC3E1CA|nr:hypothetical protein [Marinobacter sp. NP-4(2019)]AZT85166.1 hypothetical protein EHN06_17285 [Marinobacter sp. NP-4(2019)]
MRTRKQSKESGHKVSIEEEIEYKWKGVPMSSEAHLLDTTLFRGAILVPVLIGILLMVIAGLSSRTQLSPCFNAECFSTFFSLFKFQFAIMGLAIPLGALVASHHRSMQSAAQIKTQLNQNIFSNYIDHRKLFEQFFKDNNPLELRDPSSRQVWAIYDRVFPSAAYGDLSPNPTLKTFVKDIADHFHEISDLVKKELNPTSLNLKNSRIAFCWASSNFLVSDFLGISRPVVPIVIERDPIDQLRQYAQITLAIAKGLQDCANFHKFYENYSVIPEIERYYSEMKKVLEELQSINDARTKILNALENATDDHGNLNAKDDYASKSLSNRLKEFTHEPNVREYIDPEDVKTVLEHYIPSSHKQVFLDHMPVSWQLALQQSTNTSSVDQ